MSKKQNVASVVPAWGSKGLTLKEICSRVKGLQKSEVQAILEELFKNLKIETVTCGNSAPKYRCCNGVEL